MGLFKSKYEKELDEILYRLQMNLSNNYKDNAQDNLKEFEEALTIMRDSGKVKKSVISKYESVDAKFDGRNINERISWSRQMRAVFDGSTEIVPK